MKNKIRSLGVKANYGFQIVLVGVFTGGAAGLVVTLYNALVVMCEEFSAGYYGYVRDNPWFLPLLFLALFCASVVVGGVVKLIPMIRGSGFPQTEGAAKGTIRYRWWEVLPGMFAASLFCVFMGMSAGAEGPSLMIGGACGCGIGSFTRRNPAVRRYQITGGACAGLAVALNAPLTGMVFAYEEAHKRFTPEVFVCSFSSVAVACVIRALLGPSLGLAGGPFLGTFSFAADTGLKSCLYALAAAVPVSLAGVGLYFAVFALRKRLKKRSFKKGWFKYTIPFLFAGAAGLVTVYAMGGGVELIEALGSKSGHTVSVFGLPLWAALCVILVLKFTATVVNTGFDVPCCASIPMMSAGACIGALLRPLFERIGMDPAFGDCLVAICMVAFFTTVVKAPVTGLIMIVEITWNFAYLLPAVLGVAVGYLVGDIFRTEPLYERLLEEILEESRGERKRIAVKTRVDERAAGRTVAEIPWPYTALLTEIGRGEKIIVPGGSTELCAGDGLVVEGEPEDEADFLAALSEIFGDVQKIP